MPRRFRLRSPSKKLTSPATCRRSSRIRPVTSTTTNPRARASIMAERTSALSLSVLSDGSVVVKSEYFKFHIYSLGLCFENVQESGHL